MSDSLSNTCWVPDTWPRVDRQVAEMARQAASSRVRLDKLSRLRELQTAMQARKHAAATERAQEQALDQELLEQDALR